MKLKEFIVTKPLLYEILKGTIEGKEKEQETENLFEKTMKENFSNLVKEIDIQVQEAQSPKQDGHKEDHTKTHHN